MVNKVNSHVAFLLAPAHPELDYVVMLREFLLLIFGIFLSTGGWGVLKDVVLQGRFFTGSVQETSGGVTWNS